ncbi:MAG: hypothetical protein ACFFCU_17295, partial [Promethearchaeota archaeon]
ESLLILLLDLISYLFHHYGLSSKVIEILLFITKLNKVLKQLLRKTKKVTPSPFQERNYIH